MMDQKEINKFICKEDTRIIDAMSMIDTNASGIVFSVDENGKLTGSLTDGDIRRWIIRTGSIDGDISGLIHRTPKFFLTSDDISSLKNKYLEMEIRILPLIDEDKNIIDIIILDHKKETAGSECLKNIPVIIMAGGKGTRLYPYTKILPKPLIPMGETPIMERIINRFCDYGANNFYITVNYKKEMIKSYFAEIEHKYGITYVEEDKPLGTAGSIRLIKDKFNTPVVISNCDILINAEYDKVLDFHKKSNNIMTIVSSLKKIVVPYGVLNTVEGGVVTDIKEKPDMSYFINTGMYIVEPEIIEYIPENTFFHMTDLTEILLDKGMKVGTYPISEESFLDMGELEEMKRMEEKLGVGNEIG